MIVALQKVSNTFCVGNYDSASDKKDCSAESLMKSKDKCEKAARHLGYEFSNVYSIPSPKIYPSKCGWDGGIAYFNQASTQIGPTSTVVGTKGGICTSAEKGISDYPIIQHKPYFIVHHMI